MSAVSYVLPARAVDDSTLSREAPCEITPSATGRIQVGPSGVRVVRGVAETDLDDLLDTCCMYVDLQRRLIAQAVTAQTVSPAVCTAMHAALEQLETAVVHVCHPERLHLWDPGE